MQIDAGHPVSIVLGLEVCPKTGIQFQVRIHFRQELNVLLACSETRETSQKYTSYEEGASRSHQVAYRRITRGSAARLVRKCTYSFPLSSTLAHRETGYLRLMRFGEHRRLPSRARRGILLVRLGVRCSNGSERCHRRQSSTYFSAPLHEYAPSSFNSSAKHLFCVSGRGIVQRRFADAGMLLLMAGTWNRQK